MPRRAVPYTGWTEDDGAHTSGVFVGNGTSDEYDAAAVAGKLVVADMHFGDFNATHLKAGSHFIHDPGDTIPDGPLHCANWLIPNFSAYYEAWKRGATCFIGLLCEMPIDGCELYVPYDGFLKKIPAAWVGREHAADVRSAAVNGELLHYTNTGEGRTVDSHNVVGILPGRTDEFILITCHHDAPYASAVEDASGLAALLALAKAFAESAEPLERGLVFLASSAIFTAASAAANSSPSIAAVCWRKSSQPSASSTSPRKCRAATTADTPRPAKRKPARSSWTRRRSCCASSRRKCSV